MRTQELQKVAEDAAKHYDGKQGFSNVEKLNAYICLGDISHILITVDREPGVTPFTIVCPFCEEKQQKLTKGFYKFTEAQSACYRIKTTQAPTHEWYRPDNLEGLNPGQQEHVMKGGLILRKIEV